MIQTQEAPQQPAVMPMALTHGTLEIQDVQESMRFYRDFLGMEVIQHVPFGCRIALGGPWYIVCLEVKHPHAMARANHFGFDVGTPAEVDAWHARAVAEQEKYGIVEVTEINSMHGAYRFHLRDCDRNWWEIEYYEGGSDENLRWGAMVKERVARGRERWAAKQAAAQPTE